MTSNSSKPTHITVVIKGDRFQAVKAMSAAGISFAFVREINGGRGMHNPETVGRVCPVYLPKIQELFHATDTVCPDLAAAVGLPIGSILLWIKGWMPLPDGKSAVLDYNDPNALLLSRRIS